MFLVLLLPEWSIAQMQTVKFNDPQWQFVDAEYDITTYKGKESLKLSKGYALLKDLYFKDGTIQVDINFPGDQWNGWLAIILWEKVCRARKI